MRQSSPKKGKSKLINNYIYEEYVYNFNAHPVNKNIIIIRSKKIGDIMMNLNVMNVIIMMKIMSQMMLIKIILIIIAI